MAVRFATVRKVSFHAYPVWLNLAIFIAAAGFVWVAGTRLADSGDAVRVRRNLSRALPGLTLLIGYIVAIVGAYRLRSCAGEAAVRSPCLYTNVVRARTVSRFWSVAV